MFEPLKKALGQRIDQYSSKEDELTLEVLSRFQDFATKKLGEKNFQAFSFKEGEIKVAVENDFLIQRLSFFEEEIKRRVNKFLEKKYPSSQKVRRISYEVKPVE